MIKLQAGYIMAASGICGMGCHKQDVQDFAVAVVVVLATSL